MGVSRNDKTPAGKEFWEKVDRAGEKAPAWVKERVDALAATRVSQQPERSSCPDARPDHESMKV